MNLVERARQTVHAGLSIARAGVRIERPDRVPRALAALAWWGPTVAGGVAASVARYPSATAIVDDDGEMTYSELWRASVNIASGLRDAGVEPGVHVGVLADNSRMFVLSVVAAAALGADIVFLNTGFAGPQLADVMHDEGVTHLLHDDRFTGAAEGTDVPERFSETELRRLMTRRGATITPTRSQGRLVILTSGTTGRPRGAQRAGSSGASALGGLLSAVPIRARDTVVIAAPMFHGWGLSHMGLALGLSSTIVLQRRFDADATLAVVDAIDADGLVVVPVMLQRMLALDESTLAGHDTSSLRYIASSGSAIGARTVTGVLSRFGPVLYNVYGSTEVALATAAGPAELSAHPSTAGRILSGSTVRIVDDDGRDVAPGDTGRIFVGNGMRFDGYTGGGTKERLGDLLSSGDVGHFRDGLLFVEGRDDDMIVSGGENVFPAEVEEIIHSLPEVEEVAVLGVADEEFGQRLSAFVVRRPGSELDEATVMAHVRGHLARHKVPREVTVVDALPRTTTGKLRRLDLG